MYHRFIEKRVRSQLPIWLPLSIEDVFLDRMKLDLVSFPLFPLAELTRPNRIKGEIRPAPHPQPSCSKKISGQLYSHKRNLLYILGNPTNETSFPLQDKYKVFSCCLRDKFSFLWASDVFPEIKKRGWIRIINAQDG